MDELIEIRKKFETCEMLLIGKKEVAYLIKFIDFLQDHKDFIKQDVKELSARVRKQQKIIEELNRYNEALIIENMGLKSTKSLRDLGNRDNKFPY